MFHMERWIIYIFYYGNHVSKYDKYGLYSSLDSQISVAIKCPMEASYKERK